MSILTIRLTDEKHSRLKALAEARKVSMNKLIDELATIAIANHDARIRFELRAKKGKTKRALDILEALGES